MEANHQPKKAEGPQVGLSETSTHEIYVAPLPCDITEADLRHLFSLCGVIRKVQVSKQKGPFFAFAYLEFQTFQSKEKAIKFYHGRKLGWNVLKVQERKYKRQKNFKNFKDEDAFDKETVYGDESRDEDSRPKKKIHLDDYDRSFQKKSRCFDNKASYSLKEKSTANQSLFERQKKNLFETEKHPFRAKPIELETEPEKEISFEY